MTAQVERGLFDCRTRLLPSQFKEVERQLAVDTYTALALGNPRLAVRLLRTGDLIVGAHGKKGRV